MTTRHVIGLVAVATTLLGMGIHTATAQESGVVLLGVEKYRSSGESYLDQYLQTDQRDRTISRMGMECGPTGCVPNWPYAPTSPLFGDCPEGPSTIVPPTEPGTPSTSPSQMPEPLTSQPPASSPPAGFQAGGLQGGSLMASNNVAAQSNVGYIDLAVPVTMFRLRYDAAYGLNFPDRAEYFYPKCGCAGGPGPGNQTTPAVNDMVNYQQLQAAFEYAFTNRFSVFVEMPFRFIDPELKNPGIAGANAVPTGNTGGLGDMRAGFKYALIAQPDQYLTFQLRAYAPSGDASRGLGTNHVSLEPGLLYFNRVTDDLTLEGEFKAWIPINGTNFAGNILQYGVGVGYDVYETSNFRIAPIAEFVGWSVLDGKMTNLNVAGGVSDAQTTIVNGKFGVRMGFGPQNSTFLQSQQIYVGYGRALTGQHWYQDMFRLEYRYLF